MVLGCDGVGTKIEIALEIDDFTGLGHDLLAMVADDAVCIGAETIAITNTVDTKKVEPKIISAMMDSLQKACRQQQVVIPGGEIAELGDTIGSTIWNASSMGIVEREKYLTGEKITPGDVVLSLREQGFRSNGFSLIRHICKTHNISYKDIFENGITWGSALLTPSEIYSAGILSLLGRYNEEPKIDVHGIAHITGGGIAGNLKRILKKNKLGAQLSDIWDPPPAALELQKKGSVEDKEAYRTWNMGNGMLVIVPTEDADKAIDLLSKQNIEAKKAGEITKKQDITHKNKGAFQKEEVL